MKTSRFILSLLLASAFVGSQSWADQLEYPKVAALSLNSYLNDALETIYPDQLSALDAAGFNQWLQQSQQMSPKAKKELRQILQVALTDPYFRAILVQSAQYKDTGLAADVVMVEVPKSLQQGILAAKYFFVFEAAASAGNMIEKCGYYKCDMVGTPTCIHATRFNKDCPDDECSKNSDCGGSDGVIDILETESADN